MLLAYFNICAFLRFDCIDFLIVLGCGANVVLNLLCTRISTFFEGYWRQDVGPHVSALPCWVRSLGCYEVEAARSAAETDCSNQLMDHRLLYYLLSRICSALLHYDFIVLLD